MLEQRSLLEPKAHANHPEDCSCSQGRWWETGKPLIQRYNERKPLEVRSWEGCIGLKPGPPPLDLSFWSFLTSFAPWYRTSKEAYYNPSSRKQACKLITQHTAGWRWSGTSGVGGKLLLNLFAQCSFAMPTVPCLGTTTVPCPGSLRFPAWELPVPCLGTFAVPAWDAFQFPAWERLPVSCLETLASVHALFGHACSPRLGRLLVPCLGTLASSLPGNACQFPAWERLPVPCLWTLASSLPGNACQFPAWERLPVPCLGTLASSLPKNACQFPAWERLPVPCLGTLANAFPGKFYRLPVPAWDACQFPAWERLPVPCLGTLASSLPENACQFPA